MGMRVAVTPAAVFVLLVPSAALLTACGGGSEPTAQPATSPPETQPPTTEPASPATTAAPASTAEEPPPAATQEPPPAQTEPEEPVEEPPPLPGPGLPGELVGYQDWLQLNEEPIPPNPEGDAHLGTKDVFASQEADRSGGILYPNGTIVVKAATRPDKDFIGLVAVMRKEAGADPEHGDWIFAEYTREAPDARFEETAADAVCWSCHGGAKQTDWVWVHTLGIAP
jgi:hypothetical protein